MKNKENDEGNKNKDKCLVPKINPLLLLFPPDLEAEYIDYYYHKMRKQITFAIYSGLGLFLLFGILDFILLEGRAAYFWILRFLVVLPATLITAKWSIKPSFQKVFQEIQAGLVVLGGSTIMLMIALGSSLIQEVYYGGLILVVLYALIIMRIRFYTATLLSLTIFVTYEIIAINVNDLVLERIISNSFFLLSAIFLGMFASYYNERILRLDFLRHRNLEAEKKAISEANETLELKAVEENKKLRKVSKELEKQVVLRQALNDVRKV